MTGEAVSADEEAAATYPVEWKLIGLDTVRGYRHPRGILEHIPHR